MEQRQAERARSDLQADLARADRILGLPEVQAALQAVEEAERDRVFCRHGFGHLMDVARAAWILTLEEGRDLPKDLVYASALLHDLGRADQYRDGTPHDLAGADLARRLLPRAGFSEEETEAAVLAIRGHRRKTTEDDVRLPASETVGSSKDAGPSKIVGTPETAGPTNNVGATETGGGPEAEPGPLSRDLSSVLRRADKLTRPCLRCPASADCHWPEEKKNRALTL